jgi:DNA-binding transcriptional ArsR family regulator
MTAFKNLADSFGVAVVVNHHDKKAKEEDWLSQISGTRGVTGAADAVMLMTKERGRADGVLSITGRDVEEARHALQFDAGQWSLLDGPVEAYTVSATRARILGLLKEAPGLRPSEVADRLDGLSRDNAKQTLSRMREAGQVVADGEGRYRLGDSQSPVTTVTMSPGAVTGDGGDTPRGGTRRCGEPESVNLRSMTGCTVEEWLDGVQRGFPDGLLASATDRLAAPCPECLHDHDHRPQAVTSRGDQLTAFYVCARGDAWASTYADLDLFLGAA